MTEELQLNYEEWNSVPARNSRYVGIEPGMLDTEENESSAYSNSDDESEDEGFEIGGKRGFQTNIDDFLERFGSVQVDRHGSKQTNSSREKPIEHRLQENLLKKSLFNSEASITKSHRHASKKMDQIIDHHDETFSVGAKLKRDTGSFHGSLKDEKPNKRLVGSEEGTQLSYLMKTEVENNAKPKRDYQHLSGQRNETTNSVNDSLTHQGHF